MSANYDKLIPFLGAVASSKEDSILLWGGEPFLYWGAFQELVLAIRKYSQDVKIGTVTNGSLLTRNKVDFLNRHRVGVGLSHDGVATPITRGCDVFTYRDLRDTFLALNQKAISCVVSSLNQDIYRDIWGYYDGLLGPSVHVNLEFIKDCNQAGLAHFDYKRLAQTFDEIAEKFLSGVRQGRADSREFAFFLPFIQRLHNLQNTPEALRFPSCGAMLRTMNTDLEGCLYLCHNSDTVLGDVSDLPAAREKFEDYNTYCKRPKCKACAYFPLCGGGCPMQREESNRLSCEVHKILYSHVFRALGVLAKEGQGDGGV